MTYSDQLKSPHWQKKRLEILSRDNYTCQSCRDTETTLHIHHLTYINGRKPWEYDGDNFMTLCEDCHSVIPNMEKEGYQFLDCQKCIFGGEKYLCYKFYAKPLDKNILLFVRKKDLEYVFFDPDLLKCMVNG